MGNALTSDVTSATASKSHCKHSYIKDPDRHLPYPPEDLYVCLKCNDKCYKPATKRPIPPRPYTDKDIS